MVGSERYVSREATSALPRCQAPRAGVSRAGVGARTTATRCGRILRTAFYDATSSRANVPPRPALSRCARPQHGRPAFNPASSASRRPGDGSAQRLHGRRERPRVASSGCREGKAPYPRHVRSHGVRLRAAARPGRSNAGAEPGGASGRHRGGFTCGDWTDGCRARERSSGSFR